jgi:glutamyl-tRNA synthetase
MLAIYTQELKELGYLPEAVNNWLALMGWSYDDRTEIFTLEELVKAFSIEKMNPSAAAVNFSKLDHFNGTYIRKLSIDDLNRRLVPFFKREGIEVTEDQLRSITPLLQERIRTLDEAVPMAKFFFDENVKPNREELIGRAMTAQESILVLQESIDLLSSMESFDHDTLEDSLRRLAEDRSLKAGQVFGILRVAITGQRISPPIIETMVILGKTVVLKRLEEGVCLLGEAR